MTSEIFFDTVALPSLASEVRLAAGQKLGASVMIAEAWGVTLPRDLAQMVDVLGAAPSSTEVVRGSFCAFAAADFVPPYLSASVTFMLGEWFRRIALLTQTIPLGNNGGGDIWFAEVHRERSRMFVLDHDEMRLSIIADSVSSFAQLVHLEHEAGQRDAAPEEWKPLEDRVRGGRDIRLPKGFRELDVEAGCDLSDRAAAVDELLGCLWYGHEPRAKAAAHGPNVSADVRLEQLLRAFLRGEDDALATLLATSRDHEAAIVRSACAVLDAQRSETDRKQRQRLLVPES